MATSPDDVPRLAQQLLDALTDAKAVEPLVLDVRGLATFTDLMLIASGTSDRHLRTLAERVGARARELGHRALGIEGERAGEWILVDLGDVIVHLMLPRVRALYRLEHLWGRRPNEEERVGEESGP